MKIVLNSLNLALPGLPFQWLYIFFRRTTVKKHLHRIPSFGSQHWRFNEDLEVFVRPELP